MTNEVLIERRGPVQIVTINRPTARNAINLAVAVAVRDAMDEMDESADIQVTVLTGAGQSFSSGMDLKAFLRGEKPAFPGRGLCGITETPPRKPLVAAVEGWALAGGFELLLACDLIVASRTAGFGTPEVTRGMVAAGGGALLLARRIPRAVALEMLLTGKPIAAQRAHEIGLVNTITDEGMALSTAVELAQLIAQNSPLAMAVTKQVVTESGAWPGDEQWQRQLELVNPIFESNDAAEGAAAFAQKRRPQWTGS